MVATSKRRTLGRAEFTVMLAAIMASTALGIDLMLPAFGDIRLAFGLAADSTAVAGIVTAYFIGLAISQVVWGPAADRFGRKPTLYAGLTLYAVGALAASFASSLGVLYAARLVWGMGAASPRVVAMSVIRDTYEGEAMARAMSFIMAIFVLVPVVAPTLGAGILALGSWRLVFRFGAIFAAAVGLWSLKLPETLDPDKRMALEFAPIAQAARSVLANRQTLGYTLAMTALFGVFTSYLASSEIIFGDVFGRADLFPLIFGGVAAVIGLAMLVNALVVARFGVRPLVHAVTFAYIAMAIVMLTVSTLADGMPPLWLFLIFLTVQLVLYGTLFPNINTIAMDPMGSMAGMAAAVIGLISIAGGALIGSFIDQAFDGTVIPLAVGFVASGLFALGFMLWAERGRLFKPLRAE